MNIVSRASLSCIFLLFLSACSHKAAVVNHAPVVAKKTVVVSTPPKGVVDSASVLKLPKAVPYHDIAIKPVDLESGVVKKPVVKPTPLPELVLPVTETIKVPAVKVKGDYRGSVPIDDSLRQQYQK